MARVKIDEPFTTDAAIAAMVAAFEDCTWPYERWTHRAHLGVAVYYLRRHTFDDALNSIRDAIQTYNRACGDPDGYHETITVLYLKRVAAELKHEPDLDDAALVERLAGECSMAWPLTYYSRDCLWSNASRRGWLEPDLRPLDF